MLKVVRMLPSVSVLGLSVWLLSGAVHAAEMQDMKDMQSMNMSGMNSETAQAVGVVKALDKAAGTVTIAHEPIKSFNWSAMTMKFKADPKLLNKVAVGNKVRFTLQGKDMMKSTVTALSVMP